MNKIYGKLINGKLEIARRSIKIEHGSISNPTEEQLINLGYKEIEYTVIPKFDDEEEKVTEVYNEYENKIVVMYAIDQLTDEEHNVIIENKIQQEFDKVTTEDLINLYDGKKDASTKINEIKSNVATLREKLRGVNEGK